MGTISKGILGGFNGTVGTVIGATWKGISYMRSQPARRNFSPSQKQLEQQAKFGLAIRFLQPINGLLSITFNNYAVKKTGINSALSYLLSNAITGTYPAYSIDYSAVLVSRGDLPNGSNPSATAESGSGVKFAWSDNSGTGRAKATDKAILVIYCPADKLAIYTTGSAARNAASETLDASIFAGQVVETYIGFISEDGKDVATSIYTGQLTITS